MPSKNPGSQTPPPSAHPLTHHSLPLGTQELVAPPAFGLGATSRAPSNKSSPDQAQRLNSGSPPLGALLLRPKPGVPAAKGDAQPLPQLGAEAQAQSRAPRSANLPLVPATPPLWHEGLELWENMNQAPPTQTWKEWALEMAKDAMTTAVVAGLDAAVPEVAPAVAELAPDIEEALDTAASWAGLSLSDTGLAPMIGGPPPATIPDMIAALRTRVERPKALNLNIPDHALATKVREDAERIRSERTDAIMSWLERANNYLAGQEETSDDPPTVPINKGIAQAPPQHDGHKVPSTLKMIKSPASTDINIVSSHLMRPKHGPKLRRFGDHSIHGSGVTEHLLFEDSATNSGPGDYIRVVGPLLGDMQDQFQFAAGEGIQVGSYLSVAAPGGGYTPEVMQWGTSLAFHEAPIANVADERHDLHVHSGAPREEGKFTDASVTDFLIGTVANEKAVSNAIQPELRIQNQAALRALTSAITRGFTYYDNEMIYAKLLYYSMVLDEFAFANSVAMATPIPAAGIPQWVNIGADGLEADTLTTLITNATIVLRDGHDVAYSTNEGIRRIIYWLSCAGSRIDGAAGNNTPHSCYVQWPAIQMAVLGVGDVPAAPGAALPTAADLMDMACQLAASRQEIPSLVRGMYIALDLIGWRFEAHNNEFFGIKSDLSPSSPILPAPRDYNFMFRILNKFPPAANADALAEVRAYAAQAAINRTRLCALYTSVRAHATTTYMCGINLSCVDIIAWASQAGVPSPMLNAVMGSGLNRVPQTSVNGEAGMIFHPKKAFKLWLSCGVEGKLYPQATWIGHRSAVGVNAVHHYADMVQTAPPRFSTLTNIINFMKILPVEWGLFAPGVKINARSEIVISGAADRQGWYADKGSSEYGAATYGARPYKFISYGSQFINAACQYLRLGAAAAPALSHRFSTWTCSASGGKDAAQAVGWDPPVVDPVANHPYIAGMMGFEPCTILNYDYATSEVRAICCVGANLPAPTRAALRNLNGDVTLDTVGVPVGGIGQTAPSVATDGGLTFDMAGFGFGDGGAGAEPAAAVAQDAAPVAEPAANPT